MSKILITGGKGYIGSFTSIKLNKAKIISIDNLSRPNNKIKDIKNYNIDISDTKKIISIIKKNKIEKVLHLAAFTCVRESLEKKNLYKKNNYIKQLKFIDAVKKTGVKYLIFASSMSIFEKNKIIKNKPPYCKYKIMIENYLKKNSGKNFKVFVVRYPTVSGANFSGSLGDKNIFITRIFYTFFKKIKNNEIITLYHNYKLKLFPYRNYIHVLDVADLNKKILSYIDHQTKNFITFNSNTNNYYSNKDILIKISNKLKIKPNYSLKKINPGESLSYL